MKNIPPEKTIALIAYAPFVGFFIAFFMNQDKKYPFATWHIKNMFGIFVLFIASMVIQSSINVMLGDVFWLICFILWLNCWIQALLDKKTGIPVLSEKFQDWFSFLN